MAHQNNSIKSIIYAFSANLGIAITKSIAAAITGSGAMLAESIHSFADCGNQILLFVGLRTAGKNPDANYPLGYGKAVFFWSFIVALILFSIGGLFSVYEGIHKLQSPQGIKQPVVAVIVIIISMFLEGASFYGCIREVNKIRNKESLFKWFLRSRQSELVVVMGEDVAALLGLTFALVFILLALVTGNPVFDAIGSIGIGGLLVTISMFMAIKIKGLLIGQSVDVVKEEEIKNFLVNRPEIESVLHIITLQLGPRIMVSVKARMTTVKSVKELIDNINRCEAELKKVIPEIQWSFFEPDITD